MTSDEWNELDDEERAAKIEIALDDMADAAEAGSGEGEGEGEEKPAAVVKAPAPTKKPAAPKKTTKK
jgi:hypothetical protein